MIDRLVNAYTAARQRLILLDYDGVLAPITSKPEQAAPHAEVIDILTRLASHKNTKVVVVSGRDQMTLERWLGGVLIDMSAEHGHFFKENGQWQSALRVDMSWREDVMRAMDSLVEEYPGSHIETKQSSVVWHYRMAQGRVEEQAAEERISRAAKDRAEVMPGKCVIDVRAKGADKGSAVKHWYEQQRWDFVLCIGDDVTDEAMFAALPQTAWTIKVGHGDATAKYVLASQQEAMDVLRGLSS